MKAKNYHMMSGYQKVIYHLSLFFKNLPHNLKKFFKNLGKAIACFFIRIVEGFANFGRTFSEGNKFTKLSFLIMGLSCLIYGPFWMGLSFFLIEILFILFIKEFAILYLVDLTTLGTQAEVETFNEAKGIMEYITADNSMLILLYSVLSLVVISVFIIAYIQSTKECLNAQHRHEREEQAQSFKMMLRSLKDENYHITLLSIPTLLLICFTIIPLIFMILLAFTNYDANHQPPGNLFTWVGFGNFKDVFGKNAIKSYTFLYLLRWDLIWSFFATFLNYILGMILAMMINKKGIRGKKIWRTIFVITIAVPQFVTLLLMSKILGDNGTVNLILERFGLSTIPFLTDGHTARIVIIIVDLWVGIPYTMLITSGILMNIPSELYESAKIDGANAAVSFFKITLPYVLFVTTPYLITQFVGNFNNFNVIYLLTGGGPQSTVLYQAGETDLLVTWLYKLTINYQDYNLASVIGILVFVVSASLSLIVFNMSSSVKNEEQFQ